MASLKSHFNYFEYKNKSFILDSVDFCNQGVYALFGDSKRIQLFKDVHGDKKYRSLQPNSSFKIALLISCLAFPLLFFTIPYKLLSSEQAKKQATFKLLKRQEVVMPKFRRIVAALMIQNVFKKYQAKKEKAAVYIQRAFRAHLDKKKDAAVKIQRTFRIHLENKKRLAAENSWINRIVKFVNPLPYIQKHGRGLLVEGIKMGQRMIVDVVSDAIVIQTCALTGLDPSDVKMANRIENTAVKYGW